MTCPWRRPAWQHVTRERNPLVCLDNLTSAGTLIGCWLAAAPALSRAASTTGSYCALGLGHPDAHGPWNMRPAGRSRRSPLLVLLQSPNRGRRILRSFQRSAKSVSSVLPHRARASTPCHRPVPPLLRCIALHPLLVWLRRSRCCLAERFSCVSTLLAHVVDDACHDVG
jgi:hypothetical protein